jgi:hypothetical protein
MNDLVTVYLTEAGERTYRMHFRAWPDLINIDENKKVTTELWDLMIIFGETLHMGCQIPFKNNDIEIHIEKEIKNKSKKDADDYEGFD